MVVEKKYPAHPDLTGGDETNLHSHAGVAKYDIFSGLEVNKPAVGNMKEGAVFLCLDQNYGYEVVGGVWVKKYLPLYYGKLATLADFQANAAFGTMTFPSRLNDNDPSELTLGDSTNKYCEVDFKRLVVIDQWRQYGQNGMVGDGRWKLQYKDIKGAWQDWATDIPVRGASWSSMSSETEVMTEGIKLRITTVDSEGNSRMGELEVYHS